MLTRSGWGALALTVVSFATGRVFGIVELYVLGAGILAALALAVLGGLRRPPRLAVRRVLEPSVVRAGDAARVDVQVANTGTRRTPTLQLWEPVGETGGATMNLAPLRRREATAAAYRLPTGSRGVVRIGPMQARRRDVLGLFTTTFVLPGSVELLVIPRYSPAPFPVSGSSGRLGEHLRMRAFGQSGSEFHSLREYVVGDDLRRISWKASARSEDFLVKETALEGLRRCTVAVDIDDTEYTSPAFERAMSAAAALVTGAVASGLTTRLVAPEVDLRGPDVAPLALRWLATANHGAGGATSFPSLRAGEGLGLLVLITGSPSSVRATEVRNAASPDDTIVIVATASLGERAKDRFLVDATTDEGFAANWPRLSGGINSGSRRPAPGSMAVIG